MAKWTILFYKQWKEVEQGLTALDRNFEFLYEPWEGSIFWNFDINMRGSIG
jgi:hypothetical protein